VLLLPSVALASVWAPALVLSAAQTVLPPSVLAGA
jgi:hypothetical protein